MELTQNGRYIGTSKKYDIAINAVQDTRARQSLPMEEHSSSGAKPVAKPGTCAGGHHGADRKQQQPRQGEIKQYSANKLESVARVPALTSSTLLLSPLRHRRFPCPEGSLAAAGARWEKGERVCFAGQANAFLQPISIALYLPAAARNLARQIRKAALPILPVPAAGEVWQPRVFWSWGRQLHVAGESVAKSQGFGWQVPRSGSCPWGWQSRLRTHLLQPTALLCFWRVLRAGAALDPFQTHPSSPSFLPSPSQLQ